MNGFYFRRFFVLLIALAFMTGLPTQGISTVAPSASTAAWMMDNMPSDSGDCDDCAPSPLMSVVCPAVFCLGLTAIVLKPSEIGAQLSKSHARGIPATKAGMIVPPNTDPPRSIQS